MAIREIPNDIEAEQSVLGSMFLTQYAQTKAIESLQPESFYNNNNAKIFTAIKSLVEAKTPVDLTTVTSELKSKKQLGEIGGVEYLTEVLNIVPTAANIDHYIAIVESMAIRRNLIDKATEIATLGYSSEESINETLDEAERKILNVIKNRRSTEFRTIQEVVEKAQENLEKLAAAGSEVTGIPTGWDDIDKITAGLQENALIIVAARPAMGKTAWAVNLATYVSTNTDKTVALFNMEMGAEQLANRMLASLGQIELNKIQTGKLMNTDWKRVNEAISQLSDANMYIDDTPGITVGEMRAKCRRLASSENGLGLIIIDYLQLITGSAKHGGNRQQEVSEISRALKTMAMELKVPVVALAQLSRSVEGREDKRPLLSDLRESGSIEQDADIVAFLYRDDYYNKESRNDEFTSISEFIISKHRNGPTATVDLLFKRNTSTFLNYKKDLDKKGGSNE